MTTRRWEIRSVEKIRSARFGWWLLMTTVVAGALLRFRTLGSQSFWLDEAFTHGIVAHGFGHLWVAAAKTESTPPLYYVLVWLWSRVFGLGEVGLRSFSAVCGTLTIAVMWATGRRLVSDRVGLVAAALTAVNPLLLWYSQEARAYSLLVLLSALSLMALARALEHPTPVALGLWGLVCALSLATHYFATFLLLGESTCLVFALWRWSQLSWRSAAFALGPILATALALLPLFVYQWGHPNVAGSGSLAAQLGQMAHQAFGGYGGGADRSEAMLIVAVVAIGLAAGLMLAGGLRERERVGLAVALGVSGVAILAAIVVAATVKDYLIVRNLLEAWPALCLLLAICLCAPRIVPIGLVGTAALVALSASAWVAVQGEPYLQRADWRGIVRAIGTPTGARALVSYPNAYLSLAPFVQPVQPFPPNGAPIQEIDVLGPVGAWLGYRSQPLRPAPAPRGFARTVVNTTTYVVVRYRAAHPMVERPPALVTLYPGLPSAVPFLQAR